MIIREEIVYRDTGIWKNNPAWYRLTWYSSGAFRSHFIK
jgi:hypothetical protein